MTSPDKCKELCEVVKQQAAGVNAAGALRCKKSRYHKSCFTLASTISYLMSYILMNKKEFLVFIILSWISTRLCVCVLVCLCPLKRVMLTAQAGGSC